MLKWDAKHCWRARYRRPRDCFRRCRTVPGGDGDVVVAAVDDVDVDDGGDDDH